MSHPSGRHLWYWSPANTSVEPERKTSSAHARARLGGRGLALCHSTSWGSTPTRCLSACWLSLPGWTASACNLRCTLRVLLCLARLPHHTLHAAHCLRPYTHSLPPCVQPATPTHPSPVVTLSGTSTTGRWKCLAAAAYTTTTTTSCCWVSSAEETSWP